jgi:hypothetical protein
MSKAKYLGREIPLTQSYVFHLKFEANDELMSWVLRQDGVISTEIINRYTFQVTKGELFEWPEVIPNIEDVIGCAARKIEHRGKR